MDVADGSQRAPSLDRPQLHAFGVFFLSFFLARLLPPAAPAAVAAAHSNDHNTLITITRVMYTRTRARTG